MRFPKIVFNALKKTYEERVMQNSKMIVKTIEQLQVNSQINMKPPFENKCDDRKLLKLKKEALADFKNQANEPKRATSPRKTKIKLKLQSPKV